MKISKKIIGAVLVCIMIFNVFGMSVFADFASGDTAVKLMLDTEFDTYKPGDTVKITVSQQCQDDVAELTIGGQYEIGYPSSAIKAKSYSSSAVADHGVVGLADNYDSSVSGVSYHSLAVGNGSKVDENGAADYGWDEIINLQIGDDFAAWSATSALACFSFEMVIPEDATAGTYTIGFNQPGYDAGTAFSCDANDILSPDVYDYANLYEYGTCTFTIAGAEPTVSHEMLMGRMDNWDDANATKFDAGFVGRISNLDPAFDADGESQAIESIVVNITRGNTTLSGKAHQLYKQDDGSYLFRAVVLDAVIADTADLSYEYIVTLTTDADGDGQKDTVTYSSEKTTSFNAIHADANDRRPA